MILGGKADKYKCARILSEQSTAERPQLRQAVACYCFFLSLLEGGIANVLANHKFQNNRSGYRITQIYTR